MANIKSARKRARQNITRRARNVELRSRFRTAMKKVLKAAAQGDKDAAASLFRAAVPEIDKAVSKGLIKKNQAARYKSRLNARVRSIA